MNAGDLIAFVALACIAALPIFIATRPKPKVPPVEIRIELDPPADLRSLQHMVAGFGRVHGLRRVKVPKRFNRQYWFMQTQWMDCTMLEDDERRFIEAGQKLVRQRP